jgi:hypothetical protein
VVRRGGTVAAYVWDFAGHRHVSQHFMKAMAAIAPGMASPLSALNAESTTTAALLRLFAAAGLDEVEATSLDVVGTFQDFDDYWISNTGFKSAVANVCKSLSASQLQSVKEMLREDLPVDANGKISVEARASAVRGIRRS